MSETDFPTDSEFSTEELEAANDFFQLYKLQSEPERILFFFAYTRQLKDYT